MDEINLWGEMEDGLCEDPGLVAIALSILEGNAVAYSITRIGDDPAI